MTTNSDMLTVLMCDQCGGDFDAAGEQLVCQSCGQAVPLEAGKPLFTVPPEKIVPTEKRDRAPHKGTVWRRENWRFLREAIAGLPAGSLVLDVGSGRGDFASLLADMRHVALEVYPYPETDLVCDLTQRNPLRPESVDAIILANVLEHVYNAPTLMAQLARVMKPGAVLLVAIPFLLKVHQAPVDYVRFTHFALERLGEENGLAVERLEGVYDAAALMTESLNNIRWWILPQQSRLARLMSRVLLAMQTALLSVMAPLLPGTHSADPHKEVSPAPLGYHVVYRKR